MLLHVLLAVVLPNFQFDISEIKPQPLTIEIMQPKPPTALPQPIVEPEPIKPEPIKKEEPIKQPKPIAEPAKPIKQKSLEPAPTEESSRQSVIAEPPPSVIAVEPKVDTTPEIKVAPPPEPQKNTGPSEAEINAAKATFTDNVQTELRRNHRYPKIAEKRGIQGETKVRIVLDKEGNVVSVTVVESSGNDSLDQGAIDTVRRSNLKKYYPDILQGRTYEITVPISFTIANP